MNIPLLRKLHLWTGVSASAFLLILAVTGIVLDHRDQLKIGGKVPVDNKLGITRGFRPEDLPVSPSQAVEMAFAGLGEGAQIQKIELKTMGGGLVYKIETKAKQQIHIDPATGSVHETANEEVNIARLSKMLHAGEGLINNAWLYDAVALALAFLAVSGVLMFIKRQRR